jgi:hypothetical protein
LQKPQGWATRVHRNTLISRPRNPPCCVILQSCLIEAIKEQVYTVAEMAMEIINFEPEAYQRVSGRGICPHCSITSVFQSVGTPHKEVRRANTTAQEHFIAQVGQCAACADFVLILGLRRGAAGGPYGLRSIEPLGKPKDTVNPAVPPLIAADMAEAIRCEWIKAYKAAVAMCRRAVQAAALDRGATPNKKLVAQIDELATKQVITVSLKEMAHEVRLTGNDGAHPGEDGLNDVTPEDAKDIIQFTEELFHHVYVMPAKLKARQTPPAGSTPVSAQQ